MQFPERGTTVRALSKELMRIRCFAALLLLSCSPSAPAEAPPPATPAAVEPAAVAAVAEPVFVPVDRGGRLFDKWWAELKLEFVPANPKTPEADGKGGPFDDGTLPDIAGKPIKNPGHAYRLKNLFGWDLRGAEGIYGAGYQGKSYVATTNLLREDFEEAELVHRLTRGYLNWPAYGKVLPPEAISEIAAFVMAVREGRAARPDEIWKLSAGTPKNYVLNDGADVAAGHDIIAKQCSGCHGEDGTAKGLDGGKYSLGSFGRTHAYEMWFKLLSGQPRTPMHGQLPKDVDGKVQSQAALDIIAALCDRARYPASKASKDDAPAGDVRCAKY